jgi:aminoglycoside phosphotransferase (APT) family kinase protein
MMTANARAHRPPPAAAIAWVRENVGGARVLGTERLAGGTSHANHLITLDHGPAQRVVLRLWNSDGVADEEFPIAREIAALTLLERESFAAPRLLAADPRGDRCGTPALLMSHIPGEPPANLIIENESSLTQLATAILALHRIAQPWPGIPGYRPYHVLKDPRTPGRTTQPKLWERVFAELADGAPPHREVLIHRDYHPGNTLWVGDRLSGVVDWSTASRGPAGVDLGHMRWNLVLSHGERIADEFLGCYRAVAGDRDDRQPYWDLRTLVDLLPDHDPTGAELARLEPYMSRLLAQW